MGNHATRKALAQRLKELGYGKLYKGNKRVAWRYLGAEKMKDLLAMLNMKPGDIVHDCDGFNHVVKGHDPYRRDLWIISFKGGRMARTRVVGWIFNIDQMEFEHGAWSCGCSAPDPPVTRDSIETWMRSYVNNPELEEQGWTTTPFYVKVRELLDAGEHIVDEQGILLPELRELPRGVPVTPPAGRVE